MTVFDDDEGRQGRGAAQVQRLVTVSGALVSLALVCGMAYWGYKLLVRDVNGVPVVQAMEGAFRIAPEDPGGSQAPFQGLAVNEVAADGSAGGRVDQVTLAPPPVELADEDEPREVLADGGAAESEAGPEVAPQPATEMAEVEDGADLQEVALAAEDAGADLADLADPQADEIAATGDRPDGAGAIDRAVAEALADLDGVDEPEQSAARSLRPSPRPAALRTATAALAGNGPVTVSARMPAVELDVAALDSGTRLVQLGAYTDPDAARGAWSEISGQFPEFFAGKRRVVQQATSGGMTFYRLRAEGFDDVAEAQRFCATLMTGQADCIPVELR